MNEPTKQYILRKPTTIETSPNGDRYYIRLAGSYFWTDKENIDKDFVEFDVEQMSTKRVFPEQQIRKQLEEVFNIGYESGYYDCHHAGIKKNALRWRQTILNFYKDKSRGEQ